MSSNQPSNLRSRTVSRRLIMFLVIALLAIWPEVSFAESHETQAEMKVIFLVRHAEKMTTGSDPDLTAAGQLRAEALAGLLKDADIRHVHSTDFTRTRNTAMPIAAAAGLTVNIYDPSALSTLATTLRATKGRHLVVGHSNTTTKMVKLLGGDPGSPIDDGSEFDRVYVLSVTPGGAVNTVLLRY